MPRYVLLRHDCPPDYRNGPHWDFMLEHDGALWTWSLAALPAAWCDQLQFDGDPSLATVPAIRLADHRLAFLEYEGPLSGNRGEVRRVAAGEFAWSVRDESRVELSFGVGMLGGQAILGLIDAEHWQLRIL